VKGSACPRFRFRQDSTHSGEKAACCDPPVFAAPGGKMLSLQVASVDFIFCSSHIAQKKKASRNTLVANGFVQCGLCIEVPVC
jgi:hypothetical protein